MIVLYLKSNNQFLQAIKGFPEVKEMGNRLCFANGKVIINDLTKGGYALYPEQEINVPIRWDEDLQDWVEVLPTLEELNLKDFTEEELKMKDNLERDIYQELDDVKTRVVNLEVEKLNSI